MDHIDDEYEEIESQRELCREWEEEYLNSQMYAELAPEIIHEAEFIVGVFSDMMIDYEGQGPPCVRVVDASLMEPRGIPEGQAWGRGGQTWASTQRASRQRW
jgi:hypothetical protein